MGFCYAAQVVECSVLDEITGKVTAHKVWVVVDVGRALTLFRGGANSRGVCMGMGQAMSEETRFDEGRMMHGNSLTTACRRWRIVRTSRCTSSRAFTDGPFGAKEASEGMLAGFLPAMMDAVHEAVGIRPIHLPLDAGIHHRIARLQGME